MFGKFFAFAACIAAGLGSLIPSAAAAAAQDRMQLFAFPQSISDDCIPFYDHRWDICGNMRDVIVTGYDEQRKVRNINIENVTVDGKRRKAAGSNVLDIGKFVEGVAVMSQGPH